MTSKLLIAIHLMQKENTRMYELLRTHNIPIDEEVYPSWMSDFALFNLVSAENNRLNELLKSNNIDQINNR